MISQLWAMRTKKSRLKSKKTKGPSSSEENNSPKAMRLISSKSSKCQMETKNWRMMKKSSTMKRKKRARARKTGTLKDSTTRK